MCAVLLPPYPELGHVLRASRVFERAHLGPEGRQHNPSSVRDLLLREPVGHQPKHLEKVTSDLAEGSFRVLAWHDSPPPR